jgi:hypothetical protein
VIGAPVVVLGLLLQFDLGAPWCLSFGLWVSGRCVWPCVGISGRLEIDEVIGRFAGFVGPGSPTVGRALERLFLAI